MPGKLPMFTCPKCLHEFECGGTSKICRWCNKPFSGNGNRRYCTLVCKTQANNWRLWQRLRNDPEYKEKNRVYMKNYMRTYPGPRVKKAPDGV